MLIDGFAALGGVEAGAAAHLAIEAVELVRAGRIGEARALYEEIEAPLIGDIDGYFPIERGSYSFGIMCLITWGQPTLLWIKLGVLLQLGDNGKNTHHPGGRPINIRPKIVRE